MLPRALVFLLVLSAGLSAAWAEVMERRDYRVLNPVQQTDAPGKIEVIQFFSYGCPHCADMHHLVSAWVSNLPKDVAFRRVPVSFGRPAWASLAKAYYALESIGAVGRIDEALYRAIHEQRLPLVDEPSLSAWMTRHGVDARKFAEAYKSFHVHTQAARADGKAGNYAIDAVPTFAVAGKYVVIGRTAEQMLAAAGELVSKVRKEGQARR